jgi:hypothetical protein
MVSKKATKWDYRMDGVKDLTRGLKNLEGDRLLLVVAKANETRNNEGKTRLLSF